MSIQLPIDYKPTNEALEFNAEHARRRFEDAASRGFPSRNQAQLHTEMIVAQAMLEAFLPLDDATNLMVEPDAPLVEAEAEPVKNEFSMPMPVFLGLTPTPAPQEPETQPIAVELPEGD